MPTYDFVVLEQDPNSGEWRQVDRAIVVDAEGLDDATYRFRAGIDTRAAERAERER